MFGSTSEEAKLAEQIYTEKYQTEMERDCPGKIVAIDITTQRAFVGEGIPEVLQRVADEEIETTVFVKQIGSKYGFFEFRVSTSARECLKAFEGGDAPAYTIAVKSDPWKEPYLKRKLDDRRQSLLCWTMRESAQAVLARLKNPDLDVVEVRRGDIELYAKSKAGSLQRYAVEMII